MRKGGIVADINGKEIIEVFTILSSLEVLAAKLAVQKLDDETKSKFEASIKMVEDRLEESNYLNPSNKRINKAGLKINQNNFLNYIVRVFLI